MTAPCLFAPVISLTQAFLHGCGERWCDPCSRTAVAVCAVRLNCTVDVTGRYLICRCRQIPTRACRLAQDLRCSFFLRKNAFSMLFDWQQKCCLALTLFSGRVPSTDASQQLNTLPCGFQCLLDATPRRALAGRRVQSVLRTLADRSDYPQDIERLDLERLLSMLLCKRSIFGKVVHGMLGA